jgi:cyclopropane-fatty-acyl-phospholipid synthase
LNDLDAAEEAMLEQNCRRAQIRDGMDILDLGCGAGSLSFWLAEKYPNSRILAVSNVTAQREFIQARCKELGIGNIECRTADINDFQPERRFDRVVSIELFDHMRNYKEIMARISSWLNPGGKLFVHMVTHREYCIAEQKSGFDAWVARHFFYGGLVVPDDMLLHFQEDLVLEDHWLVSGQHFQRTVQAWLANLDARREQILSVLQDNYSRDEAARWVNRWRIMLMVFEEAFGCHRGEEWIISQYLFHNRGSG